MLALMAVVAAAVLHGVVVLCSVWGDGEDVGGSCVGGGYGFVFVDGCVGEDGGFVFVGSGFGVGSCGSSGGGFVFVVVFVVLLLVVVVELAVAW